MLNHATSDPEVRDELRLDAVTDISPGIADRKANFFEELALRRSRRLKAGGAGNHCRVEAVDDLSGDRSPLLAKRCFDLAGLTPVSAGADSRNPRSRTSAARTRVIAAFKHQERTHIAEHEAAMRAAIPNWRECFLQRNAGFFEDQKNIPPRGVVGAAHERQVALSGGDARLGDTHRVDAGRLLAEERARGSDDTVNDRNIAGEQIGKLCQEQGGAQIAHQPFVEEPARLGHFEHACEDAAIGLGITFAAGGGNDQIGAVEQIGFAGEAGIAERKTGGVDADALPHLHLPLIAFLRYLLIEIHRSERMHDVGCKAFVVVRRRITAFEMIPRRLETFAQASDETNAGDPNVAALCHLTSSATGTSIRSAHSIRALRNSGLGKVMTR